MAGEGRLSVDQRSAIIPTDFSTSEYRCIQVSSSTKGKGKVLVPRKSEAPTSVKIAALSNMYVGFLVWIGHVTSFDVKLYYGVEI